MLRVLAAALLLGASAEAFLAPPALPPLRATASGRQAASSARCLRMADELGRIGRLAKDRLSGAKEWVEDSADARGGTNFRGAGAGALAGGLLAGPFGAVLGGYLGKGWGAGKAADKEAAKRLGLTPEVMQAIADLDSDVTATREDFELVKQARDNLIKRKEALTADAEEYYERAKKNLESDNEEGARTALTYRRKCLDDLEPLDKQIDDANFRCEQFQRAMASMEDRLQDILDLQARSASASVSKSELNQIQDPLLEKFKKWENEEK